MAVGNRVPIVDLTGAFVPGTTQDVAVDAIRLACEDTCHNIDLGDRRFHDLRHT